MTHPLDKPIWSALATRQRGFAQGGAMAQRFPADVSPFVAAKDGSAQSAAAVVELIPPGDNVSFLEVSPPEPPAGIAATIAVALQMTWERFAGGGVEPAIEPLGDADVTEMLALATLTRPGPFRAGTHTLGRFIGVRDGSRLVAMAGERLKVDGFVEISAVCTHPDYRGRGLGGALMQAVGNCIRDEGDVPFLHTYAHNTGAIALYRKLGFQVRAEVAHSVWSRAV